jgi:hypothetical protein
VAGVRRRDGGEVGHALLTNDPVAS